MRTAHLPVALLSCFLFFHACHSSKKEARNTAQATKAPMVTTDEAQPVSEPPVAEVTRKDSTYKQPQSTQAVTGKSDSLLATIERTACYGTCPVYSIEVYKNGYVRYKGIRHVENTGTFAGFLPGEKIQALMAFADSIGYFRLNDRYDDPFVTDLPTTLTSLVKDGKRKSISNYRGAPEELFLFEKFFDALCASLQWIPIKAAEK